MYRKLSLLFFMGLLTFSTFSCACDRSAEAENEMEESTEGDGIKITYENDEGETESVNINIDEEDLKGLQNGLADAFDEVSKSLRNEAGNGEAVEVRDFRDLKAILPERLLGMDRTKHTGEKSGAFGLAVSQAEARYREDNKSVKVQVVDGGQLGVAKLGVAAWTSMEIDREGDFGYERTIEIDGHKAFEKWNADSEEGELVLLYEGRYIITLNGKGLDEDELRKALRRIDYEDLE